MKKVLLFTIILASCTSLKAQFVYDYLKGADDYYAKGDYASAAEYYEKSIGKDKDKNGEYNPYTPQNSSKKAVKTGTTREMAVYRLAECYRMLNYPSKAEPYYKETLETSKSQFPLAEYHYATQLRALEKYAEAEQHFKTFTSGYSSNDEYKKNAERELKNLAFIQQQLNRKDLKLFRINKAEGELTAKGASYAPAWVDDGYTLFFTSTRPLDTTAKEIVYNNRLLMARFYDGSPVSVELSKLPEEKGVQQGVASVTPDGNTIFLTRWSKNKKGTAAIYTSSKTADGWSDPVKLDASVNADGYHSQQPFVTPDGKYLIYSSNKTGGSGGFDLWYAPLQDGKPGASVNMGSVINTSYDEQAASYHAASRSLVFSSNGRVGMGGYDFFLSKGSIGNWSEPVNMGYPVNSVKDDIYFVSRGTALNVLDNVMLSSDRGSVCCLELFSLQKERPLRQLSGKVVSCDPSKPLSVVTVMVVDTVNNKTILSKTLGADGSYSFTLESHLPLKVTASANDFITKSVHMSVPSDPEEQITMRYPDICLVPVPPKVNETFVIENVYYDFNKSDLKPESYPALDEVVRMLNTYPNMVIELGAHTDSKGSDSYNMKLSDARAQSVVNYLVEKGIAPERLVAKGYGESMPVEPNEINGKDNPEGREKNRRTEFKVLKNDE